MSWKQTAAGCLVRADHLRAGDIFVTQGHGKRKMIQVG